MKADLQDDVREPGGRPRRFDRRRFTLAIGLIIVISLVWASLERKDAIEPNLGSGLTGPIKMRPGTVFAAYYGQYRMAEAATITEVTPRLDPSLVVEDFRLLLIPGSTSPATLPHGCEPISFPFTGGGMVGGIRDEGGQAVNGGESFYAVVYLRATRSGEFTTEAPVDIKYKQWWWPQRQTLENQGLFLSLDVQERHPPLDDRYRCEIAL